VTNAVEGIEDLLLENQDTSTGIIIDNAEMLCRPDREHVFAEVSSYVKLHSIPALFFFELFPDQYAKIASVGHDTTYYQNILYYPLHNRASMNAFIYFLERYWSFTLPKALWEPIFQETGGYLWLAKEIVRQYRQNKSVLDEIIHSRSYDWKIHHLWERFGDSMHDAISDAFHHPGSDDVMQESYIGETLLWNTELEDNMPGFIKRILISENEHILSADRHTIRYSGLDISHLFSYEERSVLLLLISKKNLIVPRDELAKARWGDKWTDQYSDWAIDQAMYRIRKKLAEVDKTLLLRSYRKKGYGLFW